MKIISYFLNYFFPNDIAKLGPLSHNVTPYTRTITNSISDKFSTIVHYQRYLSVEKRRYNILLLFECKVMNRPKAL